MTTERCNSCHGLGEIQQYYPSGRRVELIWQVCRSCQGAGTVEVEVVENSALDRAHQEGLAIIATQTPGMFMVSSGISRHMFYKVTRTSCTCWAGQFGKMCKHRALACEAMDTAAAQRATGRVCSLGCALAFKGETQHGSGTDRYPCIDRPA